MNTVRYQFDAYSSKYFTSAIKQPVIIVRPSGKREMVKWLGLHDEKNGPPTLPYETVKIYASEYTVNNIPLKVNNSEAIKAYIVHSKNYTGGRAMLVAIDTVELKHGRISKQNQYPILVEK